jgi:hypothetical protein
MMTKATVVRTSDDGQFAARLSAAAELVTLRSIVSDLKKKPAALRELAVKASISTPTGRLTKAYRSK